MPGNTFLECAAPFHVEVNSSLREKRGGMSATLQSAVTDSWRLGRLQFILAQDNSLNTTADSCEGLLGFFFFLFFFPPKKP